jgi:hypothetical protein
MKDAIQAGLDAVFDKHEESKRAVAAAKLALETKESEFLRAFLEAAGTMVRPAMEAIGSYIQTRGYDYGIATREDGYEEGDPGRRHTSASIAFELRFGSLSPGVPETPGVTVVCDKVKQRVRFYENTTAGGRTGHSGSTGEVELSALTAELVQQKILDVVAEVFR